MKTIVHSFGTDLSWAGSLAEKLGGKFENNFIVLKNSGHTDIRYALDCGEGITVYYVDAEYDKNLRFIHRNPDNDFIGLYYNLTEGEGADLNTGHNYKVGLWKYNFSVIDGALNTEYTVKRGTKTFLLAIFIDKKTLEALAEQNNIILPENRGLKNIMHKNILEFGRISASAQNIINDLRKFKAGGAIFDLALKGTIQMLLSDFFIKISRNEIFLQSINENDLSSIISSQIFLAEKAEAPFPSIKIMAEKANMSESKFQVLFKKVTGLTPNSFFLENKIYRSKELLEKKQFTVAEISDKFNFSNHSYFCLVFKRHFGISPRTFAKQL